MSMFSDQEDVDRLTRTCQIILGALIAGVSFFLAIAVFIDPGISLASGAAPGANAPAGGQVAATLPILTYTALAFAVVLLPLSVVVPRIVTARSRRAIAGGSWPSGTQARAMQARSAPLPQTDAGKLAMVYSQQLIIGAAINEGLAFFAGVAYFIERNPIALGLAAVLVAGLVARFPTSRRVQLWIESQQEKLHQEIL
jgi:hypothetical protein